jgi:multiple sugar transport system substrate-binding protein
MVGFIFPSTPGYDEAVMSYETLLWSYGGDWGDYTKGTVTIDSPGAVEALKMLKALTDTSSATGRSATYGDINTAFAQGKVSMAMTYMAFFPSFTNKKQNADYYQNTGFFNVPAGPKGRFTALGGQGMSINAHISADQQKKAKNFLKWFAHEEIQMKWAELGGYTANTKVMASDTFKKAAVYNELFPEAFGMMKDFWNNPKYDMILSSARNNVSLVIQGKKSPEQAAADMQKEQTEALK